MNVFKKHILQHSYVANIDTQLAILYVCMSHILKTHLKYIKKQSSESKLIITKTITCAIIYIRSQNWFSHSGYFSLI